MIGVLVTRGRGACSARCRVRCGPSRRATHAPALRNYYPWRYSSAKKRSSRGLLMALMSRWPLFASAFTMHRKLKFDTQSHSHSYCNAKHGLHLQFAASRMQMRSFGVGRNPRKPQAGFSAAPLPPFCTNESPGFRAGRHLRRLEKSEFF